MILEKTYSGIITKISIASRTIKTPEDEKIKKNVGIVGVELDYNTGDLEYFVDGKIPDDIMFTTASWDERVGKYSLNINEVILDVKVIKIERKNKEDACKFSLTFETEQFENMSILGNYIKDKENPSQIKLSVLEDE